MPVEAILEELNQAVGIKGSLVITKDGMFVAGRVGDGASVEMLAAVAGTVVGAAKKTFHVIGLGAFDRFLLRSSRGRVVFLDVGPAFLVVVADTTIPLEVALVDVNRTAYRIRKHLET